MTENEDPSHDRLKQHFAQRVIHQARQVLEIWQRLQRSEWNDAGLHELRNAVQTLQRYAERFAQTEHHQLARELDSCLQQVGDNRGRLNSELIIQINLLLQRLSRTGLRHSDRLQQTALPPVRKPLYLALNHPERVGQLVEHLEFFGMHSVVMDTANALRNAMAERHPAAIVMDVDFSGSKCGLELVRSIQSGLEQKIPIIFFSLEDTDTRTRLEAARVGGREFFSGALDASNLYERIEELTHSSQYHPYKVMIIDDSLAQATHTERTLNSAGIITRTLTEPIEAMQHLASFQPDLIILDMYMPECNGPELAQVIRNNDRYVSVPIIYLSAEDDLDKQLDAMSEGGDDFLTKPIKPRHLIATVRNRAARARSLKARMVRDSLTGLYNHTHTLQLLEDARLRAGQDSLPMSFAMLDIDFFKKVNDTYGHPMGDRVIKSLAMFLKQRLRKTDLIGRYGGEEFAVIMPATDAPSAARVLDEIRKRFAEVVFPTDAHDLTCTFSCGVAQYSAPMNSKQLTEQADEALYAAKHSGRNQVCVAGPNKY